MWWFFPFYLRNSALPHVLIYLFKIHVDRGSNLTFLRDLKAELGIESRCECGLLSLAYAVVALNGQVVAVLDKCIRKKWKYLRAGENRVWPWSSPLGRRNQCNIYTLLVICKV